MDKEKIWKIAQKYGEVSCVLNGEVEGIDFTKESLIQYLESIFTSYKFDDKNIKDQYDFLSKRPKLREKFARSLCESHGYISDLSKVSGKQNWEFFLEDAEVSLSIITSWLEEERSLNPNVSIDDLIAVTKIRT